MLFKAAVKVDLPHTLAAKLLTAVWGMFCVIFASSYMANLAVFMITKDDFYDFSGMDDYRVSKTRLDFILFTTNYYNFDFDQYFS